MTNPDRLTHLAACALQMSEDELSVLLLIAERLLGTGRLQYGPLNLATDTRDFLGEASDELLDGCVYLAARMMQRRRGA